MYKLFFSCILLFHLSVNGQTPKKTKENTSTQKEMEDMMKQAQEMMKQLSPEDKKMMDSLGIKMPSFNNIPKVGDKALADAYAEEMKVVPAKKTALINAMPKTIFSKEELIAYVKKTNVSIAALIKPASKQVADKIIAQFKNDLYYGYMIASAANGMWMMNYKEAATYLMGKAVEAIPNADHLNNYAAYLTMGGAAHIAIPILNKINSLHKNNSTVLNNLGQAWLQLGDETTGEKYLDNAIMIYQYHPQANYTKCLLLTSRGKKTEAIAALNRSLKHSVTVTKLNKLRELEGGNYRERSFYVPRVYYSTTFNLHTYAAMVPKTYALSTGGNIELQWEEFRQFIKSEIDKIDKRKEFLAPQAKEAEQAFFNKAKASGGNIYAPYHAKAVMRSNSYKKEYDKRQKEYTTIMLKYTEEIRALKSKFNEEYAKVNERTNELIRQGASIQQNCKEQLPVINNFLSKTNALNQRYNEDLIQRLLVDYYNMYYYYPSTANTDASAEITVLSLRAGFLSQLYGLKHESDLGYPCSDDIQKKEEYRKLKPLKDFDEVNCKILNTIYSPGLGTIVMRCNTMSLHLNPVIIPFEANLTANFDGFVEQASVGITVKPVKITAGAEFDENGNLKNADAGVSAEVELKKDVEIGINGSITAEFDEKGFKKGSVELGISNEMKFLPKELDDDAPVQIGLKNELGVSMELSKGGKEGGDIIADFGIKQKTEGTFAANIEVDKEVELTPGTMTIGGEITKPEMVKLGLPSAPSVSVSADSRWSVNSGYSAKGGSSFSKLK